ncbi:hypothetical protein BG842_24925 [Haladaptatus sp. W1]|nr:hypothetical protein BG842_24925 [Haladaptatus sp. W1]
MANHAHSRVGGEHAAAASARNALHANNHIVLDGSELAAEKARRVFTTDPGMGVIRHADAGYDEAIEQAEKSNVAVPMRDRT